MDIKLAVDVFFINRKSRNLSKATMKWYKLTLEKLLEYTQRKEIKKIEDVQSYHIEELLVEQREKVRDITVKDFFVVYRAFFNFLFDEEYIERNPMKKMKAPKVAKKIIRTFSPEEINKILNFFETDSFLGLRNHLAMCLLFSTGMRRGELINIKVHDINTTLEVIKITGKGNKQRIVPIGRAVKKILIRYLKEREEFLDGRYCDYLMVSYVRRKLTGTWILHLFHKIKEELGMEGERFSPHTLRHSFARTALLNGMSIFVIQKIMGHEDLATTRKYIALNDKEIRTEHAKFDPLANRDWEY